MCYSCGSCDDYGADGAWQWQSGTWQLSGAPVQADNERRDTRHQQHRVVSTMWRRRVPARRRKLPGRRVGCCQPRQDHTRNAAWCSSVESHHLGSVIEVALSHTDIRWTFSCTHYDTVYNTAYTAPSDWCLYRALTNVFTLLTYTSNSVFLQEWHSWLAWANEPQSGKSISPHVQYIFFYFDHRNRGYQRP